MSNDGGTAFPAKKQVYRAGYATNEYEPTGGMSLRDYFAAKAMHANLMTITEFPDENWRIGLAKDAWAMADIMLKTRGE